MKKTIFPLSISVFVILFDQVTKFWVLHQYAVGDTFGLIPGILEFCYVENYGSAMGIVSNARWPLVIGTAIAIIACVFFLFSKKCTGKIMPCAFGLVVGGGIGNLIDRVFLGYVVDFVRFPISWFHYSFNIADCAVCLGCGLLVLELLLDFIGSKHKKDS